MDKEPTFKNNVLVINEYHDKLQLNGNLQKTVGNKLWKLTPFFRSIKDKPIKNITRKDIDKYLLSLKKQVDKKKLKESTYNQYIAEIRRFFNWLVTEDDYTFLKDRDLLRNLKFIEEKEDTSEKHYVEASDVKKMLPFCKCQRDRALAMLLWNTACRIGELLDTDIKDANLSSQEIKVTGKTGTRELPITTALPDLKLWLNQRSGKQDEPLFTSKDGISRLSIRGAQEIIQTLGKNAGIKNKKFNCHAWRHGRLTELANKGMPEMHLRVFAGWKPSSQMTETYIHPKAKEVKNRVREIDTGKKVKLDISEQPVDMNPKVCYNCNAENAFDAKYCSICSVVLDENLAMELKEVEKAKKAVEMEEMKKTIAVAAAEAVKNEIASYKSDLDRYFSPEHIHDKLTADERKEMLRKLGVVHQYDLEHDPEYRSKFENAKKN